MLMESPPLIWKPWHAPGYAHSLEDQAGEHFYLPSKNLVLISFNGSFVCSLCLVWLIHLFGAHTNEYQGIVVGFVHLQHCLPSYENKMFHCITIFLQLICIHQCKCSEWGGGGFWQKVGISQSCQPLDVLNLEMWTTSKQISTKSFPLKFPNQRKKGSKHSCLK